MQNNSLKEFKIDINITFLFSRIMLFFLILKNILV